MKWDKPNGSTQWSTDKRYFIVQANSQQWIAYIKTSPATGDQLGEKATDAEAREVCEEHERDMLAWSKRA